MTKRDFLVIFILAVLVTGLSWFYEYEMSFGLVLPIFSGTFRGLPLPFAYLQWTMKWFFSWTWFVMDVFFWFLILTGGWWILKKVKKKK